MSEPKDDDWGMTLPNLNLDPASKPSAPNKTAPPAAPTDDWGMTAPDVKIPLPPDPDKTVPNIEIPKDISDAWAPAPKTIEEPAGKNSQSWSMPDPVFRVSEGAKPNIDKPSPMPTDDDFGQRTVANLHIPPAQIAPPPANFDPEPPAAPVAAPLPQKKGNMKWILLLGGLFSFFLVVTVAIVAVYFLYFTTPGDIKSSPAKAPEPAATKSAPVAAAPASLPQKIDYKGEMMLVAAGEFTMGANDASDEAKPAHSVTLPDFYIDRTEVTNADYKAFCDATGKQPPPDPFWEKGYFEKRPKAPVLGVSFDDAKAYAAWAGKRLPTEQEWEKAASWDPKSKSKLAFPWGANFENGKAAFGLTTPKDVGSFAAGASPSGALDMAGNVAEWVDSFFTAYPGDTSSNPNFGETNRVVRGGHFSSKTNDFLKTSKRIYVPPTIASGEDEEKLFAAAIGFRCAVSADDARVRESITKSQSK